MLSEPAKKEVTPLCKLRLAMQELESSPQGNDISNWKQLALDYAQGEERRRFELLEKIRTIVAHQPEPWLASPYQVWGKAINHIVALPILNPTQPN